MKYLKTHAEGHFELLTGIRVWSEPITAVLVMSAHGVPDRIAEETFGDISDNECPFADYSRRLLENKSADIDAATGDTVLTHDAVLFTADNAGGTGTISGRYVYYVFGLPATLTAASRILGHYDLTGAGDAGSVDAVFRIKNARLRLKLSEAAS